MIARRSLVIVLAMLLSCGAAWSYWHVDATGTGAASAATVNRGGQPSGVVVDGAVTVTWDASTLSNGDAVDGYVIARYDAETLASEPVLSTCAGTITATACTESDVPPGSWVYAVTPLVGQHWRGAESLRSVPVVIDTSVVPLGRAGTFSVLGAIGVTSTGATLVSGDLGTSPTDVVVGFPPGVVGGDIYASGQVSARAQTDLSTAYDVAAGLEPTGPDFAGDLNGQTFHPGVRHTAAALALTGTLTLDGDGDPNAVFVFQVDAALNTAAASHVVLINGAKASNVYWQVLGAANTGANATFAGTILAQGAITLGADSQLIGRALSRAAVTMASNTVRFTDALAPTVTFADGATHLTKDPTPTISGTSNAVAGRTVTVTVDGQTLTAPVLSDGTWSVTAAALAAGVYTVVAKVRDAAGNAGFASQQLTAEINPDPVDLGSAAQYSVLGGTGVTSTGATVLAGDLGVSPSNAVVGFPPGIVQGTIHAGDSAAGQAQADAATAYTDVAGRASSRSFAGDQNGQTFRPGVHRTTAAFALTGTMTFDADGDPDAVFIIQVGAALNTAAASQIVLVNDAQASNVHWQVLGAAGLGATSHFVGTILAKGGITIGAGAQVTGRALSVGTVTLAGNGVSGP
ncbi:ice-binding family protein [Aeromicrobium sp. UC242_57]|uniref:ice-binding family protein n=1 Tax=Aeromicrobium sp. UC242_57 TaxID=3374624 RepID=UPI003793EF40